jgi:hypothetical protein
MAKNNRLPNLEENQKLDGDVSQQLAKAIENLLNLED